MPVGHFASAAAPGRSERLILGFDIPIQATRPELCPRDAESIIGQPEGRVESFFHAAYLRQPKAFMIVYNCW